MSNKLNILWTSSDVGTAHNMVFMYATNAKINRWWDEINIIIWGASSPIAAEDDGIKERIKLAMSHGVTVEACISCANNYGVTDKLLEQGITVKGMGIPLTEILKSDEKLITI